MLIHTQSKAAGARDTQDNLLKIGRPSFRQPLQMSPFHIGPLALQGVAATDNLVDEAAETSRSSKSFEPRIKSASLTALFRWP